MIFPAIVNAPWWQTLLAKLFGRRRVGWDPGAREGDYGVRLTMMEWNGRWYIVKEERTCKHAVCRLECMQNGGCKIDE